MDSYAGRKTPSNPSKRRTPSTYDLTIAFDVIREACTQELKGLKKRPAPPSSSQQPDRPMKRLKGTKKSKVELPPEVRQRIIRILLEDATPLGDPHGTWALTDGYSDVFIEAYKLMETRSAKLAEDTKYVLSKYIEPALEKHLDMIHEEQETTPNLVCSSRKLDSLEELDRILPKMESADLHARADFIKHAREEVYWSRKRVGSCFCC